MTLIVVVLNVRVLPEAVAASVLNEVTSPRVSTVIVNAPSADATSTWYPRAGTTTMLCGPALPVKLVTLAIFHKLVALL